MNESYLMDCMEYMKTLPDKAFELAIVDPPYGIERLKNPKGYFEKYGDMCKVNDDMPSIEYFEELQRISCNQIIWGGNYFSLPPCRGFVCWDKLQYYPNYSQAEFAWTSFQQPSKIFKYSNSDPFRIHPTQKPVALYEWLLTHYAKPGDRILDTHLGSGSSRIAAYNLGFDFVGCEIDKDYFDAQEKRFAAHTAQTSIFDGERSEERRVGKECRSRW